MNAYLRARDRRDQELIKLGMQMGEQFSLDMMQITLNELFGFGYDRLKKLTKGVEENGDYYFDIFRVCMEQDIKRAQLDTRLERIVRGHQELIPCEKRYPDIKVAGYDKLPRR